jgi:hypothetical protein
LLLLVQDNGLSDDSAEQVLVLVLVLVVVLAVQVLVLVLVVVVAHFAPWADFLPSVHVYCVLFLPGHINFSSL